MYNNSDELNGELQLDSVMKLRAERLAPHIQAMDFNRPRRISRFLKLPGPILATLGNFVRHARKTMH